MKAFKLIIPFGFILFVLFGCSSGPNYRFTDYVQSKEERDSILTDIVIHIYKVPRGVRNVDKFNPDHRHLYEKEMERFKMVHYFVDEDDFHYFFLIRPVRSHLAEHRRGVFGKYKVDENLRLTEFEELANTPRLTEKEILEKGKYLWDDLMHFKNLNRYVLNKSYIEFPDERVRYDKSLMEWTYTEIHPDSLSVDMND